MSIAPHTILRPFGVNPVGRYLRRHARFCFRASSAEAVNWEKQENSKRTRKTKAAAEVTGLEVLCGDGFGSVTMKDCLEAVRTMPIDDGGPPRWFCPIECGRPVVHSAPLLLFLPGTDGVGMELILHHKSLGKVFEVRCLLIPVNDRTSFGGEPLKMSMVSIQNAPSLQEVLQKFLHGFNSMLTLTDGTGDIIRMDNVVWKLKLLKSGAAYANSRLHAVQAEVLLLASGNENLSPAGEADRLLKTLKNCKHRYFRNRGHTLLMVRNIMLTVQERYFRYGGKKMQS